MFLHQGPGPIRFDAVEGLYHLVAQPQDLSVLQQRLHDGLTCIGVGEPHNGGHGCDPADHFLPRNHDSRAGAWQACLGKALGEDDVLIPDRGGLAEDDVRKGRTIGIVDDQRNRMLRRQFRKMADLIIGQHVSGRIGRSRDADGRHFFIDLQGIEVHPVLELVIADHLEPGLCPTKKLSPGRLAGITNVFRHEWKKDLLAPPIGEAASQRIEEKEEGRLTARGDRYVLRSQLPAEFPAEEAREGGPESTVAGRSLVVAQHALQLPLRHHDFLHALAPDGINLRDMCRLSPTEHADALPAHRQSRPKIFH